MSPMPSVSPAPSFVTTAPSVSSQPSTSEMPSYDCIGTFDELKTLINGTDDPTNPTIIDNVCPRTIAFSTDIDIANKYFEIQCYPDPPNECVLDLNGMSFTSSSASNFSATFVNMEIKNGVSSQFTSQKCYLSSTRQYCPSFLFAFFFFPHQDSVQDGGAFYLIGNNAQDSSLTITNCTLNDNESYRDGGGIYAKDLALTIEGSKFIDNSAGVNGGAISISSRTLMNITNSYFKEIG